MLKNVNHLLWQLVEDLNAQYQHEFSLQYAPKHDMTSEHAAATIAPTSRRSNGAYSYYYPTQERINASANFSTRNRFSKNLFTKTNPVDFAAPSSHVLQHLYALRFKQTNQTSKHELQQEVQIELQNNPAYQIELAKRLQLCATEHAKNEYLKQEMNKLCERAQARKKQVQDAVQFVSKYDASDIEMDVPITEQRNNVNNKNQSTMYERGNVARKLALMDQMVMQIFKGKEQIFDDPFGLGLEAQLTPMDALHYETAAFAVSQQQQQQQAPTRQRRVQRPNYAQLQSMLSSSPYSYNNPMMYRNQQYY